MNRSEHPPAPAGPRRKKIRLSLINLAGPVLIGDLALFGVQVGSDLLAAVGGILFVLTLAIGAASVQTVWR